VRWSALAVLGLNAVYVVALVPDALAGWPTPPVAVTGLIASLSILLGAPAIAVLFISVAHQGPRAASRTAATAAVLYTAIAVANRILQLAIIATAAGAMPRALDLYQANGPANFAEFFAWDLCLGIACVAAATSVNKHARWPRRFLAGTGALLLAGEGFYLAGFFGVGAGWVGRTGMMLSAAAWVGGLTAIAITALGSHWFRDEQDRGVRPHVSSPLSRPA
jgi:hypothetical protein